MQWNETDRQFLGITEQTIATSYIWQPEGLLLVNTVDGGDTGIAQNSQYKGLSSKTLPTVQSSGLVTSMTLVKSFDSHCRYNIRKFPFDSSLCKLQFKSIDSGDVIEKWQAGEHFTYSILLITREFGTKTNRI